MFKWQNKKCPIIFINVEGKEKISYSDTSFINEKECLTILRIIKNKFPSEVMKNSCIFTPYFGQKELLETNLLYNGLDMQVSSIDSFKGQERDFFILNTVRNNSNNEIGFLIIVKRLNVNISRARGD